MRTSGAPISGKGQATALSLRRSTSTLYHRPASISRGQSMHSRRALNGKGIVMTAALLGRYELVLPYLLLAMLLTVIHEVVVIDRTPVEIARGPLDLVSCVQATGNAHDRRDVAEQP